MAIRIITDSTCDFTPQEAQRLHIDVLPLKLIFDGQEYADGTGMGRREFYDRLRQAKSLPTTSQVNPEAFLSLFQTYRAQGDEIVVLTLSSQISGTYQSAVIAAQMAGEEGIFLVDSHSATFGMALLLTQMARMRDEGEASRLPGGWKIGGCGQSPRLFRGLPMDAGPVPGLSRRPGLPDRSRPRRFPGGPQPVCSAVAPAGRGLHGRRPGGGGDGHRRSRWAGCSRLCLHRPTLNAAATYRPPAGWTPSFGREWLAHWIHLGAKPSTADSAIKPLCSLGSRGALSFHPNTI